MVLRCLLSGTYSSLYRLLYRQACTTPGSTLTVQRLCTLAARVAPGPHSGGPDYLLETAAQREPSFPRIAYRPSTPAPAEFWRCKSIFYTPPAPHRSSQSAQPRRRGHPVHDALGGLQDLALPLYRPRRSAYRHPYRGPHTGRDRGID